MDAAFIAERITELRLARNVSEYQMSLELGQSKGYVQGITSGKCLPSAKQLFNIADYFHLSVSEFFDDGNSHPTEYQEIITDLNALDAESIKNVKAIIKGLKR